MSDDPLDHMRARAAQCRRLADAMTDQRTVRILRQMADDVEADIKRLKAEREQRD
jgi:hypothetical protein